MVGLLIFPMKHNYLLISFYLFLIIGLGACSDKEDDYIPIEPEPVEESPVVLDLSRVPYQTLSEYKLFEGEMKNQDPSLGVLPYEPISQLFTDYAHKKRFLWMPKDVKASYNSDGKILDFPTGTVLVKTFYYDNVLPSNTTRILETRLLIKKADGWVFGEYVWNENQTEATLQTTGSYVDLEWMEGNVQKSTTYRIPSEAECFTCHKSGLNIVPIGTKPQNLNSTFAFSDGVKNQLAKWVEMGYLNSGYPADITTVVDWKDTSLDIGLRVRSYLDINCAHCHQTGSYCDYRPMRFAFSESSDPANLGICITPDQNLGNGLTQIVFPGRPQRSVLDFRINSTDEATRMPLLGRTLVHEEAAQMINQWITQLQGCD